MDEDIRASGLSLQTAIYFSMGGLLALLGVPTMFSYPDQAWYFGLMFTVSAALLIYSGFSNLRKSKVMAKEVTERKREMQAGASARSQIAGAGNKRSGDAPVSPSLTNSAGSHVLVKWNFTAAEWNRFQKTEKKIVTGESILMVALITVVGGWILHDDKAESWLFSMTFSFVFAALFILLKNYLKKGFLAVGPNVPVEVIIGFENILVNGKLFSFRNKERWLEEIYLADEKGVTLVEIEYGWKTRKGNTSDEIRIPVPEGKLQEAAWLIEQVKNYR